jgi:signal recognition particle subunit SRP54
MAQMPKAETIDEKVLDRTEAIIRSMTPKERNNPQIINGSRRRRIALGSGTTVQDVNRLMKQFEQMQRMMKTLNKKASTGRAFRGFNLPR